MGSFLHSILSHRENAVLDFEIPKNATVKSCLFTNNFLSMTHENESVLMHRITDCSEESVIMSHNL